MDQQNNSMLLNILVLHVLKISTGFSSNVWFHLLSKSCSKYLLTVEQLFGAAKSNSVGSVQRVGFLGLFSPVLEVWPFPITLFECWSLL